MDKVEIMEEEATEEATPAVHVVDMELLSKVVKDSQEIVPSPSGPVIRQVHIEKCTNGYIARCSVSYDTKYAYVSTSLSALFALVSEFLLEVDEDDTEPA